MKHSPGFLQAVERVMPEIREIQISEVDRWLKERATFSLIDVREDSEWAAGRIPGAIHIGRGVLERDIENEVRDKETPLVLYCGGGFRSALAAKSLQDMGYKDVLSMAGGMRGWREKGLAEDK